MPNPMFGNRSTANGATAPTEALHNESKRYNRRLNKFNYDRDVFHTLRYGELTPFENVHCVEHDILRFGNNHKIRSHTLKAPLLSPIHIKKTYVQVDYKAILPFNWQKIYVNPTIGDDVPEDANTICPAFFQKWSDMLHAFVDNQFIDTEDFTSNRNQVASVFFKLALLTESIFSDGSILAPLGFHTSPIFTSVEFDDFEDWISHLYATFSSYDVFSVVDVDTDYTFVVNDIPSLRSAIDYVRHNPFSYLAGFDSWEEAEFIDFINDLKHHFASFGVSGEDGNTTPLNYDSCVAYQLACVNFFTRDAVDNVYNSELYRQAMAFLASRVISGVLPAGAGYTSLPSFTYNGVSTLYDSVSGNVFNKVLSFAYANPVSTLAASPESDNAIRFNSFVAYMGNIFFYQPSLRFGDYFTGAKPTPLAVGDVTTEVNNGVVNAIDSTISLIRARFLNAVNRVGRSWKDYIGLMDGVAAPDDSEPRWLATVTSRVSGFEVENTAENQGNIVTLLKSADSKYVYELEVGQPCIVIAIASFEIPRVYSRTADRFFFHRDRYDMFNKFMQYIGDQKVLSLERNSNSSGGLDGNAFAYNPRNYEYKKRYPIACGGFIKHLPGYLFITDNDETGLDADGRNPMIDSDYIRSKNSEMDRFYSSLTGFTLSSYFHFILEFNNYCTARRLMDVAPSIL